MLVKIDELQIIFGKIIDKLNNENITSINLETDNYFIISTEEWDDFTRQIEPDVGSLIDDWNSLKKTIDKKNPFTYVDFDRTASILRAISQKVNPI